VEIMWEISWFFPVIHISSLFCIPRIRVFFPFLLYS